jgi:hypothetical protein
MHARTATTILAVRRSIALSIYVGASSSSVLPSADFVPKLATRLAKIGLIMAGIHLPPALSAKLPNKPPHEVVSPAYFLTYPANLSYRKAAPSRHRGTLTMAAHRSASASLRLVRAGFHLVHSAAELLSDVLSSVQSLVYPCCHAGSGW